MVVAKMALWRIKYLTYINTIDCIKSKVLFLKCYKIRS
jgi:hypothetical protein